jgi:uncharacterized membrane protein YkvI
MGDHFKKFKRWFIVGFILNVLVVMVQVWFGYRHLIAQEYWNMAMNVFFCLLNGICAYTQFRQYHKTVRDEKNYMWKMLSTESTILQEQY